MERENKGSSLKPYEIKKGTTYIRMLPNINKYGEFGKNYKDVTFFFLKTEGSDKKIKFYTENIDLSKSLSDLTRVDKVDKRISTMRIQDGFSNLNRITISRVFFYGLIEGRIELVSMGSDLFNEILTKMTREIDNHDKSPLDPMSGIGFKITKTMEENGLIPIYDIKFKDNLVPKSIGNSKDECISFLLDRKLDMDDYLSKFNMKTHPRRGEISMFIKNSDDLREWRVHNRETRLGKLLDKKTDN